MSYFLQLFTRGHYVTSRAIARKEASSDNPQKKHEERERFVVAAVAFCIKHSSGFRTHFLRVTADLKRAAVDKIEVEVRIADDAILDLVLTRGRDIILLEFKLDALLSENQQPTTARFNVKGYGAQIQRFFQKDIEEGKKLQYLIVGRESDEGTTKYGLRYCGLPWSRLLRPKETPLESDLYDCLGVLGAPIFLTRHMKKKRLHQEVGGAIQVYQLLTNAAADTFPIGSSDSGTDYVGLNLSAAGVTPGSKHEKLRDLVRPDGRTLGWIGYEQTDDLYLSVWFYSSADASNRVKRKLDAAHLRGVIKHDGAAVGVHRPAKDEGDHLAWISGVLHAAAA